MAELLDRISAITRRDLLEDGALPGEESLTGEVPQGGVLERSEQPTSPAGGLVEVTRRIIVASTTWTVAPWSDASGDAGGQRSAFPQGA